jgi:hypothetical protein
MKRVFVAGPPLGSPTSGSNFFIEGAISNSGAYDVVGGMQLAVLALLAVGIPLGICAKAVATKRRRSALDQQWGPVFQIGFLFQLASLILAGAGLLFMSFDGLEIYAAAPFFSLMLVGDVIVGAIALPVWRSAQERRAVAALHD